ncbi:MAG: ABC transporter ATP-binding protein [Planctomycetota bacterium]|jgi:peptide/nickel transport system ATP-binding protein
MGQNLLDIRDLQVFFHTSEGVVRAVDDVSMHIAEGETLGVVGESGSGKSVTALTIMQLLPPETARVEQGEVVFLGRDVVKLPSKEMHTIRGGQVGMIFQEPMTSLNPVYRVGDQVMEAILIHEDVSRREARKRTLDLFREVDIPDPERRIDSYPHEMSGGQKQRVMIAMALSCNPKLLIADEPTTALDVTIQAQILDTLRSLRDTRGMSIMFITHDLGVIAEISDHIAVMFRGHLVEYGPVVDVYSNPQHPYTRSLLACRPTLETTMRRLPTTSTFMDWHLTDDNQLVINEQVVDEEKLQELGMRGRPKLTEPEGEPILTVRDLRVHFPIRKGVFSRVADHVRAVDGISFDVWKGQTLGLVGESGCGKTTCGRALLRLIESGGGVIVDGEAIFDGNDIFRTQKKELQKLRRRMQIIFQDPYSSLNPRMTVADMLMEPMNVHNLYGSRAERTDRAVQLLEETGLMAEHMNRYPHEFSGGQRQRISIARALAVEPEFIICDESVSALDVSVQAQVLNLLKDLQEEHGFTYIFISHDLSVVKFFSDTMAVMENGKIVEYGNAEDIYANPQEEYTKRLIAAVPRDDVEHIRMRQEQRIAAKTR